MTNEQNEIMKSLKVNLSETLPRFLGDEGFFIEMLQKFAEDKNFYSMKDCIDKGDFEEAFKYAHTVKGVAANLGLGRITEIIVPLTDELRYPPYDTEVITNYMTAAEDAYSSSVEYLRSL